MSSHASQSDLASSTDAQAPQPPLAIAHAWLQHTPAVALAIVTATWGSSPVPVGSHMVIAPEDRFAGSVSGGCIEGDIIASAADVMADGTPRLLDFGVSNETAWRVGLPCGGNVQVLVLRLQAGRDLPLLAQIANAAKERERLLLEVGIATGALRLFDDDEARRQGLSAYLDADRVGIIPREAGQALVQALLPQQQVVVIGATHIAQHLVAMLRHIDCQTIVVDPRSAYASAERFADIRRVTLWPREAFANLPIDPSTAVVALSHVADIDDDALACALRSGAFYIGALGSTRNHARRKERLLAAGFSAQQIARIKAPIGLDIGAVTPSEIAASIFAEIILARRGAKHKA